MKKDLVSRMDRNSLTQISFTDVERVVTRDSKLDIAGPEFVCDSNTVTYYILINTWLLQFNHYYKTGYRIREQILDRGLIPVISDCSKAADSIVANCDTTIPYLEELNEARNDDLRNVLQLLRYPKRLSPAGCSGLEKASLQAFQNRENRTKLWQRKPLTYLQRTIIQRAREILAPLACPVNDDAYIEYRKFSDGATGNGSHTLVTRVCEAVTQFPDCLGGMSYAASNHYDEMRPYTAHVSSVPKSYKARRIIAQEDSGRQYMLSGLGNWLWEKMQKTRIPGYRVKFSSRISLKDQQLNQILAFFGSITDSYATEDFSAASDNISYSLAWDVLPPSIMHYICKYRAELLAYPSGKTATCQMFLTSGNRLTFICESLIFLAITISICEYISIFTGEKVDCFVYGDDTVIRNGFHESFIDIVKTFGWEVNEEKSFSLVGQWQYRESCGVEYLNGNPCDTSYFTRKTLNIKDECLTSIVDLQHRLFATGWKASSWLADFVMLFWPNMTTSPATDSEACDLWGFSDQVRKRVPMASFINEEKVLKTWREIVRPIDAKHGKMHITYDYVQIPVKHVTRKLKTVKTDESYEVHAVPTTLSFGQCEVFGNWTEQEQRAQYDLYCYVQFLQHGPQYEDDWCRLAGVTMKRPTYDKAARPSTSSFIFPKREKE